MNDLSGYGEPMTDKDVFSQHSDPLPLTCQYSTSTVSDGRMIGRARSFTEEDIMLASSHPKKPTGRKKFKETRHPVYRGVRRRNSNRWVCEVREPNKKNRIWLGTYPTAEMAARAHDVAALALRGVKSCLNFADSAWRLPVPVSNAPEDIQRAAAEAAEMFKPEEYEEENLNKNVTSNATDETQTSGGENQNVSNNNYETFTRESQNVSNNNYETFTGEHQGFNNNNDSFSGYRLSETNWEPQSQQGSSYYHDDEAVFDMPGFLNSMAEGLLLPPPSYNQNGDCDENAETDADMNLWNF